jgi:hypothetical protein
LVATHGSPIIVSNYYNLSRTLLSPHIAKVGEFHLPEKELSCASGESFYPILLFLRETVFSHKIIERSKLVHLTQIHKQQLNPIINPN